MMATETNSASVTKAPAVGPLAPKPIIGIHDGSEQEDADEDPDDGEPRRQDDPLNASLTPMDWLPRLHVGPGSVIWNGGGFQSWRRIPLLYHQFIYAY